MVARRVLVPLVMVRVHAGNLERLLEANAVAHVNHPRGARFENGELIVSSIYRWFVADFGGGNAGVLKHLRQYARP